MFLNPNLSHQSVSPFKYLITRSSSMEKFNTFLNCSGQRTRARLWLGSKCLPLTCPNNKPDLKNAIAFISLKITV